MANLINQVVKKTSPSLRNLATAIRTPLFCNPTHTIKSTFISNSIPLASIGENPIVQNPNTPSQFFYPSFPFGYNLNPTSIIGSDQLNSIGDDFAEDSTDDARTVWADSVKKKRKKKMNKHKYKKLRKRLRRKA